MSEEPVIVTSTSGTAGQFESITLDFETGKPSAPNPGATTTGPSNAAFMGNAMLDAMKSSLLTKVNDWKNERFQTFRPMGEFFNRANIALPQDVLSRVQANLAWYQTNYLAVLCALCVYCSLTSPVFFIVLGLSCGLWVWHFRYREGPARVQGYEIPEQAVLVALGLLTALLFYAADLGETLFWIVALTGIFSLVHALLLVPQPRDEFGFGVSAGISAV